MYVWFTIVMTLWTCQSYSLALPRNLSEIRYHFTPCGSNGAYGPTINECKDSYRQIESPITNTDDLPFAFENDMFEGAQGFCIPRDGVYNITIAGAAGGRGVCNLHYGQGAVHKFQLPLSTDDELLILVGQRGVGPCDANPTHSLCDNPPTNVSSASLCDTSWYNWTSTLESPLDEIVYNSNGGAGGGGASMIWARNATDGTFKDEPIFVSAGGGGSAAILNYSASVVIETAFEVLTGITLTITNEQLYQYHLNGRSVFEPRTYFIMGERGYRPSGLTFTAGAGGGYDNVVLLLSDIDGKSLNVPDNFALGGTICAQQVLAGVDPNVFLDTFGGFGSGGGGCGGGGGGGGYTGGAVFGTTNDIPGGGGHSMAGNLSVITSTIAHYKNPGEGYVDIIPADCGCAGECVVEHDTDQFECFCPENTTLASDGFDCFRESDVEIETNDASTVVDTLTLNQVYFTEVSVYMFSIHTLLRLSPGGNRQLRRCAIVFLDEDQRPILVSNIARPGYSLVDRLAMVTIEETEAFTLSSRYSRFLNSSLLVTGAVLISEGDCSIANNSITMNISTQVSNKDPAESENLQSIFDESNMRHLLHLSTPSPTSTPSTSSTTHDVGLIAGIVVTVCVLLIIVIFIMIVVVLIVVINRRTDRKRSFEKRVPQSINLRPKDEKLLRTVKHKVEILVISSQHLTLEKTVGEGEFGRVCKAKLSDYRDNFGTTVAVKTLKGFFNQQQADDLLKESKKMDGFHHPNILGLIGICLDGGPAPFLVMPFMEKGSLLSHLRKNNATLVVSEQETDFSMV